MAFILNKFRVKKHRFFSQPQKRFYSNRGQESRQPHSQRSRIHQERGAQANEAGHEEPQDPLVPLLDRIPAGGGEDVLAGATVRRREPVSQELLLQVAAAPESRGAHR